MGLGTAGEQGERQGSITNKMEVNVFIMKYFWQECDVLQIAWLLKSVQVRRQNLHTRLQICQLEGGGIVQI